MFPFPVSMDTITQLIIRLLQRPVTVLTSNHDDHGIEDVPEFIRDLSNSGWWYPFSSLSKVWRIFASWIDEKGVWRILVEGLSRILPLPRVFWGYANTAEDVLYCLYGARLAVYSLFPVNPLLSSPLISPNSLSIPPTFKRAWNK